MDFKKNIHIIYISIIILMLIKDLIIFNKSSINLNFDSTKHPIDYQLKYINDCYLTIHNFVSINSTIRNQPTIENSNDIKNDFDFKTYIYSYTKPYLIEMIQNSTKDCLCCN
jgi:hypothetical protein